MPPVLALILWLFLLLALFRFDPAKEPDTSLALWIPLIWMFIVATRLPAQWLGASTGLAAQGLEEGNPIDRAIFVILIALAVGVLLLRSFNWSNFISHNIILAVFLLFALVSIVWSDFPLVAFKRWFRDLGTYIMILVVLSDKCPPRAVSTLLRRLCYLVVPLSVLLVKYYPEIGRRYSIWTGSVNYIGPATGKNGLGALCLISGIYFLWDTMSRWANRNERATRRVILINLAFMVMTVWLLHLSDSATSRVCLALGCLVVWGAHTQFASRHPAFLKLLIPMSICFYLILAIAFDMSGDMAEAVGRDPTFTDRTLIWNTVLSVHSNPLVGTGYESFWLGPRLKQVWQAAGTINEAHNGYLEVYLNLGSVGVFLLVLLLIASYSTICKKFAISPKLALLNLSIWTIAVFYNMTEAAFKFHLMWFTFLLAGIDIQERVSDRAPEVSTLTRVTRKGPSSLIKNGRSATTDLRLASHTTWLGQTGKREFPAT